jgi:uncharacterized membrane protein
MVILRRAFLGASIAWAVLLPIAPFAASQPSPAAFWYGLAFVVYGAGSFICHQLPARSFHAWSAPWPVCARCTGIYLGAAVAAIVATVRLKADPLYDIRRDSVTARHARLLLMVAAFPTAATLVYEWTTGITPSNAIRALAGAPLGAAVAFVIVEALRGRRAGSAASTRGRA